jgi:hypothetical protein
MHTHQPKALENHPSLEKLFVKLDRRVKAKEKAAEERETERREKYSPVGLLLDHASHCNCDSPTCNYFDLAYKYWNNLNLYPTGFPQAQMMAGMHLGDMLTRLEIYYLENNFTSTRDLLWYDSYSNLLVE